MMRAETPEQFGRALRWGHVPVWVVVLSLVGFVRVYLRAGRPWLAWTTCALRTVSLLLNFVAGQNLNYREITEVRHIRFLGESVSIAHGVSNPWMLAGQLSLLLFVVFVIDAAISVWRRGDRRQALTIGGSITFFVVAGTVQAVLVFWQIVDCPLTLSLFFMGVVAATAHATSRDLRRAAQLSHELRESEERMTLAAEAAGFGVWIWTIQSNEVWASERWLSLFGFPADTALTFEKVIQRIHPDDRERVEREVRRAVADGSRYVVDFRAVLPDGTQRWFVARGRVYPDEHGNPARMLGATIDITERKVSEAALRESEARFRAIADTAPVLIWIAGTDRLCNFFNQGWLDFTGRALEQELGNGWSEGVHPDDLAGCLKNYVESFDARRPFTLEYRLRRHDGEYRWISDKGVPRYDSEGNFLGYIGSCVDLTERKRTDEKFRLAVEASPNGIVLLDALGRIVLVNAHTEQLFGYTREELIGQAVEMLVPERFRGGHPGHQAGFLAAPEAWAMGAGRELFARRKDGTEFAVEVGLSPIQGAEGNLVLTAIVDITARKQAEAEALRRQAEVAHVGRVATVGELASSLAHELNQPLGAILRNAEAAELFLQSDRPDLEEVRAILVDIRKDDQRAGAVIDRIRSMIKRGEVEYRLLDLKPLASEVINLVHPDADSRKVKLALKAVSRLPTVRGDRVQLQQVLLNLLINALDAVKDCEPEARRVTVNVQTAGTQVEVAVIDTGHGIPAARLALVFEPFFTTKPNGLGMGLPISRRIIEAHGGSIRAENNPDGGAKFAFALPVAMGGKEDK
jgi:PAS domain S-box-containing protein